jgi:hypothetical protein
MAKAAVEKKEKNDEDFTLKEMIEYERVFGEPLGAVTDDTKPRIKKIVYLGFMKRRRENSKLDFEAYLDLELSLEEVQKDAFGIDVNSDDEEVAVED